MKLTFDNFQAEVTGIYKDFIIYLAVKNSLPKMFGSARIGCICATVLKDNSIQLVKRVGLKEKNNGKFSRNIKDGWEYFEPFKPSKIEVCTTRIKYYTKKYLHKDILLSKTEVCLYNGTCYNCSGAEAYEIIKGIRSIPLPPAEENINYPF